MDFAGFFGSCIGLISSSIDINQESGDIYTLLAGYSDYVRLECIGGRLNLKF
jgi:hypothetical protein